MFVINTFFLEELLMTRYLLGSTVFSVSTLIVGVPRRMPQQLVQPQLWQRLSLSLAVKPPLTAGFITTKETP
jgi:hypothetical protein